MKSRHKLSSHMVLFFIIEMAFIIVFVFLKIPRFKELLYIFAFQKQDTDILRLILSSFFSQITHLDPLHLLANSFFFVYILKETREFLKTRHILLISAAGVIICAMCLLIFADQTKTYVGASGWLGSLLAFCLAKKMKDNRFKITKSNVDIVCLSITHLVLPLVTPYVSLLMHLSGFLVGAACSVLFLKNKFKNWGSYYVQNTRR